jgi:hypothetical protein
MKKNYKLKYHIPVFGFLLVLSSCYNEGTIDEIIQEDEEEEIGDPFPFREEQPFKILTGTFELQRVDFVIGGEREDLGAHAAIYHFTEDSVYVISDHFARRYKKHEGRNHYELEKDFKEEIYYIGDTMVIHTETLDDDEDIMWKFLLPTEDTPHAQKMRREVVDWDMSHKIWLFEEEMSDDLMTEAEKQGFVPTRKLYGMDLNESNSANYRMDEEMLYYNDRGKDYTFKVLSITDYYLSLSPISQCDCDDKTVYYKAKGIE